MTQCYKMWIILYPRAWIHCDHGTIPGKFSLVHEQKIRQNLQLWLQPFTKSHMVGVISW